MGKSATADWLRAEGIPVLDTDDVAREVVLPETPGLEALRHHYGDSILQADGSLNRAALARIVFQNAEERHFLEQILHPLIRERCRQWCLECEKKGAEVCVVIIPLLFETHQEGDFDSVVCLVTTPEIQMQRLLERGMSAEDLLRRNAAQWPIEQKMVRSQFVVQNNGTREELERQLARIFRDLL